MRKNWYYHDAINACLAYAGADFEVSADPKNNPNLNRIQKDLKNHLKTFKKPGLGWKDKEYHGHRAHYKNGWYECQHASAYVSQKDKFLTLAFRGTDDLRESANYLTLRNHYELFKPLNWAVLQWAKKHRLYLRLVGHSLGGAMVEYFMEENQHKYQHMHGTTFGSPGSNARKIEKKITHFIHLDDTIPMLGNVLYNRQGSNITIEKPFVHLLSSHLSEEYISSMEEIPTGDINTDLSEQTLKVEKRLFRDWASARLESVHFTYNFKVPKFLKKILHGISMFKDG